MAKQRAGGTSHCHGGAGKSEGADPFKKRHEDWTPLRANKGTMCPCHEALRFSGGEPTKMTIYGTEAVIVAKTPEKMQGASHGPTNSMQEQSARVQWRRATATE